MSRWIGLDVGGANLKASDGEVSISTPFPLWREPQRLGTELRGLVSELDPGGKSAIALTMTGELADCYETKADGVRAIVKATQAAGRAVHVATVHDTWVTPDEAIASPLAVAAANWRVAARLVAKFHPTGRGLWIDAGSTTIDLIPIKNGAVASLGRTDTERLRHGELIYTGVRRTPVCAIVDRLPYRGEDCPVAAEWFATSADAWLLLGEIPGDSSDRSTADGRPLTREHAIARLARCVCADCDSFDEQDALFAAEQIASEQAKKVVAAIDTISPPDWLVVSGEGEFLVRRVCGDAVEPSSIRASLDDAASRCLPAHACAALAAKEIGGTA